MHKTVGFWRFYRIVTHVVAGVFLLLFANVSFAETIDPGKYIVSGPLPEWYTGQEAPENDESVIQYYGYNNNHASDTIPENSFYTIFADGQKIYGDSACLTYGTWGDVSDENFERGNVGGGALCWCRLNGENDPSGLYSYKSKWVARGQINDNQPCWENCAHDCAQLTGHVYRWPDNQIKEKLFDTASVTTADCPAGSYCPGGEINAGDQTIYSCPENSHSESGQSSCTCDVRYATSNGEGATQSNPCVRLTGPASCISGLEYWDTVSQSCIEKTQDYTFAFNTGEYMPPVYDATGDGYGCHKSRSATECEDLMASFPNNSWLVYFNDNTEDSFSGRSACSDISGYYKEVSDIQFDSDTTYGRHCWCNISAPFTSNKWVLTGDFENGDICENECAGTCTYNFRHDNDFKKVVLADIHTSSTDCEAGYYCPGGEYSVINTSPSHVKCPDEFEQSEANSYSIEQCFTSCPVDENGAEVIEGHKYWTPDEEHVGDTSSCVYQYKITYELFGGSNYSGAPTSYIKGTSATINGRPSRANSEFLQWCTDSALSDCYDSITISDTDVGNKKFYAKWKTNAYTIKYFYNDGTAITTSNPTQWVVGETEPFDLATPDIPDDWTFYAWFNNNTGFNVNTSAIKVTTITQDVLVSLSNGTNVVNLYAHKYPTSKFWMTTTQMNAGEKFAFYATNYSGDFYVDWGDGVIVKDPGDSNGYTQHTYNESGSYRIGLSSYNMNNYSTSDTVNADCSGNYHPTFWLGPIWNKDVWNQGTTTKLFKIEGNLSAVFPTTQSGVQPNFIGAFAYCSNLEGTIPPELFANITGQPRNSMFRMLFYDCPKLSGNIPPNLFGGISGTYTDALYSYTFGYTNLSGNIPADIINPETGEKQSGLFGKLSGAPKNCMFNGTFNAIPGLTGTIPEKLFGNIDGAPAGYMFSQTFWQDSNISGKIPENLFGNIHGAPAAHMFANTFDGTNVSGPIPQNMFRNISGPAQPWMYNRTFALCSGLTGNITEGFFGNITEGPIQEYSYNRTFMGASGLTGRIPENLFGNVTGVSKRGFYETFKDATNIGKDDETGEATPIPVDLFKRISGAVNSDNEMFGGTFQNTKYLTSPVPTELFKGVTGYLSDNEAGNRVSSYTAGGMANIFNGSNIPTSCDAGQYQYLTGFEVDWDERVACEICPEEYPDSIVGDNVTMKKCFTACPEDENGGEFVSGHKYWTEDEEHIGDISSCTYKYNITYELNGADESLNTENPTEYTNHMEEALPILAPGEREYIGFDGWFDNAEFEGEAITEIPVGSVGHKKFYAKWTPDVFSINYELDGGTNYENAPTEYTIESETITFETPTKEGYRFLHWLDENEEIIAEIPTGSNGDKTLTAVWEAEIYNVIYDYTNGGAGCENETYSYDSEKEITCVPEKIGYVFTGWYSEAINGDKIEVIPINSIGDKTLYAQWVRKINIHFEANAGEDTASNIPDDIVCVQGETCEVSWLQIGEYRDAAPSRNAYSFAGWNQFIDGSGHNFVYIANPEDVGVIEHVADLSYVFDLTQEQDITLYAQWSSDIFHITYELDGGTNYENAPTEYTVESDTIVFGTPTKDGFRFLHWLDENNEVITELPTGSTGDKTLTAVWVYALFNVIYDYTNGGSGCANETYSYEYEKEITCIPEKTGYVFTGWYSEVTGGDKIEVIPINSTGDKTLYAQWTQDIFHINYELDGGTNYENAPTEYTVESETITFDTPTKEGFTFLHWLDENDEIITEIPTGSTGDKTLTAVWELAIYNIIYDYTNGGSGCENETYSYDSEKEIICIPENTGYVFTGWYSEVSDGDKIEVIPINSTGDKTLYAQWVPRSYYIKYVLDGGRNYTNAPLAYTYGTETIIDGVPTRQNFLFDGWCYDEELTDCGDTYIIPDTATGKKTVYAKWTFNCDSQKWLHIGENEEDKICLYSEKPSGPSIAIKTRSGVYYLPLFDDDLNINKTSSKKMYIQYNDNVYNIHDDSAN